MSHTFKQWLIALRPWSFPASSMPALVVFVYTLTCSAGTANWVWGILALVGAVIFQIAGNLVSDYFDYRQGVDREDTFGSSRMLVNGTFAPKTILWLGVAFLAAGTLIGLFLYTQTGWPLLIIGGIGVLSAFFYYKFKYMALGDALIFVIYGPMISLGTSYVMTSAIDWRILILSLPIGCITTNILHANNTRDIPHDKRANIRTLAMLLGIKGSIILYNTLIVIAYLSIIAMVATGMLHRLTLLLLLTLPVALKNCKLMGTASLDNPSAILGLDVRTAQLQLMFSVLFSVLLVISYWL